MTTADTTDTMPSSAPRRRAGGYLFLPRAAQTPAILPWLRRVHAWTGFWGALFFFMLGLSGIYLNHRAILRVDPGPVIQVASLDAIVEPGAFSTEEEMIAWLRSEYSVAGEPARGRGGPGGPVNFNGQAAQQPETWTVSFRGANAAITATHQVGSNLVHIEQTGAGFIRMIMDLHKVVGVNAIFVLLMDTMAGGMMVMSVTGVLLWTRLHGPRLLAAGIVGTMLGLTVWALSATWVAGRF